MEQLSTVVNINKLKHSNNSLKHESEGYINIIFSGNKTSESHRTILKTELIKENDYIHFDINVQFIFDSECSRCIKIEQINKKAKFNKKLSFHSLSDYEIDFNSENIDLLPIISEIIIKKMNFTYLCKKDCKGLCSLCGKNQNDYTCNHQEKNIKESPFSSLSELDL